MGRGMLIDMAYQDHIFASLSDGVCASAVTLGIFWRPIQLDRILTKMMLKLGLPPTAVVFWSVL
jgi:hypothetical protein